MFTYLLSVVIALVLIWCLHYGFEIKKRIKIHIVFRFRFTYFRSKCYYILFGIIYFYHWLRYILNKSQKIDILVKRVKWFSDLIL